jgi:hypothetical protein
MRIIEEVPIEISVGNFKVTISERGHLHDRKIAVTEVPLDLSWELQEDFSEGDTTIYRFKAETGLQSEGRHGVAHSYSGEMYAQDRRDHVERYPVQPSEEDLEELFNEAIAEEVGTEAPLEPQQRAYLIAQIPGVFADLAKSAGCTVEQVRQFVEEQIRAWAEIKAQEAAKQEVAKQEQTA